MPQFLHIINKPAAGSTHAVGRANNNRIAERRSRFFRILNGVYRFTLRHIYTQAVHCFLERNSVFAAHNGINLDADYLDAVFVQDSGLRQFCAEVKAGLSPQVWQQGIRPLLFNYLSHCCEVKRLDIGNIRRSGVGHDSCRIRIHQHYFITQPAEGFTSLSTGVIKLAGLPDNDRPGTDYHYLFNIIPSWHVDFSFSSASGWL